MTLFYVTEHRVHVSTLRKKYEMPDVKKEPGPTGGASYTPMLIFRSFFLL